METAWTEINHEHDIEALQAAFSFHDSCIKEMRYDSGMWVDRNLNMYPINQCRNLYIVFQTQRADFPSIEMLFEGLEWLNLRPVPPDFTGYIFGAHICFEDDRIVWFSSDDFTESYRELYQYSDITWIKARKAKWRRTDSYLGKEAIYIHRDLCAYGDQQDGMGQGQN